MTEWRLQPIFDSYLLVAAAALALIGSLVVGWLVVRASGARARTLLALRAAATALVLTLAVQPTSVVSESKTLSASLVVLLDTSRSLLVPDALDGKTRWQLLESLIGESAEPFRALAEEIDVRFYAFDADVRSLDFSAANFGLPEAPTGHETAIGAALEEIRRLESRNRLLGVILISDGAQQSRSDAQLPQQSARRLADLGAPIYAVPLASEASESNRRDVAIKDLAAGPTVYVKNRLNVHGQLRVDGYAGREVRVKLLVERNGKSEQVGEQSIAVESGELRRSIELHYEPDKPGEYRITLEAESLAGELLATNNRQSTYITVLDGGLKALLVEGSQGVASREQLFIKEALKRSADVQTDVQRIPVGARDRWKDVVAARIGDRFQFGKYDVYILGGVDADAFKIAQTEEPAAAYPLLEQLRQSVEQGAGLMMYGGTHSFAPGGYGATPLAGVLPLEMDPLDRQRYEDPPRESVHLIGPVSLRPSKPLGLTHPILQIAGADNLSAWQTMPPLDGANRFRRQSIKAAASVLAETPEGDPLLLSTMYGDGRVLAFAGDSTWRWRMAGRMDEHLRFWRQTVFFLAKKDIDDSDVWIRLAGRRFDPGRAVHFTAGARTKDGRPRDDAVLTAAVTKSDGATSVVRLVRQGDAMAGTILDTLAPGDYRVTVSAQAGGQTLEPASARFIIDEQDYELDAAQGDPSLLRNLAELTAAHDGRFVYPEEFPALIESLQAKPKELQVEVQSRWTFGQQSPDAFAALFVVVALLGVEWFLRKKWGLA